MLFYATNERTPSCLTNRSVAIAKVCVQELAETCIAARRADRDS